MTGKIPQHQLASRSGFLSNLTAVLGGQLSCAVVALLIQACYARLLGPAGRGEISLCLMVIAFGVLVGGLGSQYPLAIWTAESKRKSSEWLPAITWIAILGCVLVSALWTIVYWKWHPTFLKGLTPSSAIIATAGISVGVLFTNLMSMLTGLERFRLRAALGLSQQVIGLLCLGLLVFFFGAKPNVALLSNQLGILICSLITVIFLHDYWGSAWDFGAARRKFAGALNLGLRGQPGNLATFFNYRLDVFVVNYFLDTTQVGLYAVGVLVAEGLWQIPQAASLTLLPRTARTLNAGATQFTCMVIRHVVLVACATGAALALLSPFAVPLIFGARFTPSVPVIWWILPGTIALSVAKVICADLAGRAKPEFSSICACTSLVVTIALDLLLVPRMGINGAALASSVAYTAQTILLAIALKQHLRVSWKSLLVPSLDELAAYRLTWLRFKARLRPASAPSVLSGGTD